MDIRNGSHAGTETIERLRASWSSTSIFAVAATAEPDQILQAMRAGANEYLAWSQTSNGHSFTDTFQTALKRAVEKARPAKEAKSGEKKEAEKKGGPHEAGGCCAGKADGEDGGSCCSGASKAKAIAESRPAK